MLLLAPLPVAADGGAPNLAYIAGAGPGVSVLDLIQQRASRTLTVPGDPRTLVLSTDGNVLYVTQPTLGRVTALDAASGRTLCTAQVPGQPTALVQALVSHILYAAGPGASTVSVLDATNCALMRTIHTPSPVYGLAVALFGTGANLSDRLWVVGSMALTIFDEQGRPLASIPVPDGPQDICAPQGTTLYVSTRQGTVVAVNLVSSHVTHLLSGGPFGRMDYDAITGQVYVPDLGHHQLDVLAPVDPVTSLPPHEPLRTIPLEDAPQAVAITNDGQLGLIALSSGKVAMLDVPARHLIKTFTVGGTPHFIITGLYPSAPPPPSPGRNAPPQSLPLPLLLAALLVALSLVLFLVAVGVWWHDRDPSKPST
jgi:DNA-binding beta-propeller fold protein YncE